MKTKFPKRSLSAFIALTILSCATPAFAVTGSKDSQASAATPDKKEYISADADHSSSIAPVSKEFVQYLKSPDDYGTNIPSPIDFSYLADSYKNSSLAKNLNENELPESYDLRDYGRVPRVENQGSYGTCWAFAANSSAESGIIKQFPSISLSKAHLAWFSYAGLAESELYERARDYSSSIFDFGGSYIVSAAAMSAWKGPVLSDKLPYSAIDDYNMDLSSFEDLRYDADFHLQDVLFVPSDKSNSELNSDLLKSTIIEYGCTTIDYNSSDEYYNYKTNSHYCYDDQISNHAVLVVGWDDNYPKENFNSDHQPEHNGAWLIENSWGADYGDSGFFWLSYYDKSVCYNPKCFYNLESADNYTTNYQYDLTGYQLLLNSNYTNGDEDKTAYAANLFTAKDNEQLEAVSFYTTDADTQYQISIYTDLSSKDPKSGKLVYSGETNTEPYAGYHTIELENAVKLTKNTDFSVIVKLSNPNYEYPVAVNCSYSSVRKDELEYSVSKGVGFISPDGDMWEDVNEYSYFDSSLNPAIHCIMSCACIKAFTNPLPEDNEAISNVRFSELEGPIAIGTKLYLDGDQTINYQIDGGDVKTYDGAITIDKPCTITAWGVKDGKTGNKVSRTYTMASAQLCDLVSDNGTVNNLEINDKEPVEIYLKANKKIRFCPRSEDNIEVDGKKTASDEWTDYYSLSANEGSKEIKIEVSGEGKNTTTYVLKLININKYDDISIDYEKETISYNEDIYEVVDKNGKFIPNGSSVSDYSVLNNDNNEYEYFVISDKQTGDFSGYLYIPKRQYLSLPSDPVDLTAEASNFACGPNTVWSSSEDNFTEIHIDTNKTISFKPGVTYHVWKMADENSGFVSDISTIEIADRPDAPVVTVEDIAADYIRLSTADGCEYRLPDGEWQDSPEFDLLEPNTTYNFEVRIKSGYDDENGTKAHFASEITTVTATTLEGEFFPVRFVYHGTEFFAADYGLHIGENVLDVTEDLLLSGEFGFIKADNQEDVITVNVSNNDGKFVADRDIILNVEMINYDDDGNQVPVSASDYTCTIYYQNTDSGEIIDSQIYQFPTPGYVEADDIHIPEGYLPDYEYEDLNVPYLDFYEGIWRVYGQALVLPITMNVDPSEPSDEQSSDVPSEPSDEQSSDVPSEPSDEQSSDVPSEPSDEQSSDVPSESSDEQSSNVPSEPSDEQSSDVPSEPSDEQSSNVASEPDRNPTIGVTSEPSDNEPSDNNQNISTDNQNTDNNPVSTGENATPITILTVSVLISVITIAIVSSKKKKHMN